MAEGLWERPALEQGSCLAQHVPEAAWLPEPGCRWVHRGQGGSVTRVLLLVPELHALLSQSESLQMVERRQEAPGAAEAV